MRVLVVEDNPFNSFCLRRLLESMAKPVTVTVVNNSQAALLLINSHFPDIVIIDGDLGAKNELHCNGPQLADMLLQKYPELPLIAWSDSESMRKEFAAVFLQHDKFPNEYNTWPKVISLERIYTTWNYHFAKCVKNQSVSFVSQSNAGFR